MTMNHVPDFRLSNDSPAARAFVRRGVGDFSGAVRIIGGLPGSHGSWHADDPRRVLPEGRGSRAAKHALLATLAMEHRVPLQLVLGIYEIDAGNTPSAAGVLRGARLGAVPDADCFLSYDGRDLDLTCEAGAPPLVHREPIAPAEIGSYRIAVYHRFLWEWTRARGWEMGAALEVRRRCVEARDLA